MGLLAPDAVTQHAKENPAQWPECEGHGKHGEGFQQRGAAVTAGEKLQRDGGCQKAVHGEIEPFDEVADGRRDDDLFQRGRIDLLYGGSCHG